MPTKSSLLERAIEVKRGGREPEPITAEEIEVAIAWLDGRLGMVQAATVLIPGKVFANVYTRIAFCLREAYKQGQLHKAA